MTAPRRKRAFRRARELGVVRTREEFDEAAQATGWPSWVDTTQGLLGRLVVEATRVPDGCEVNQYSSRSCEHGTRGCVTLHEISIEPGPQPSIMVPVRSE